MLTSAKGQAQRAKRKGLRAKAKGGRQRAKGKARRAKTKGQRPRPKTKTKDQDQTSALRPWLYGIVMSEMTVKRRAFRAGGWAIVKRLIKPIPVIGSLFAVGLAGYEIKKKGLLPGAVHVGLDVTPVVGTAKNVVEIFTGDLIPDKADRKKPDQQIPLYEPPKIGDPTAEDRSPIDVK